MHDVEVNQKGEPFLGRSVKGFTMMLDFLKSDGEVMPKDPYLRDLMVHELSFFELDKYYELQLSHDKLS